MKAIPRSAIAVAMWCALGVAQAHGAGRASSRELVILSTADANGQLTPCDCHVPRGGLARRAAYIDSIRATHDQVLVVDAGWFFPKAAEQLGFAPFMMKTMRTMGVDVAGVSAQELGFGLSFLRASVASSKLAVVCANLADSDTQDLVFPASAIRQVGGVRVGVFGLMSPGSDLGPARDSLAVTDPRLAARHAVAELQRQGATVIVALSQLDTTANAALVNAVPGIDVTVIDREMTLAAPGEKLGRTLVVTPGAHAKYIAHTVLALDAKGHVTGSETHPFELGPNIAGKPEVEGLVKQALADYHYTSKE